MLVLLKRVLLLVFAGMVCLSAAPAAKYQNFDLAIYCRVYDVQKMEDPAYLEKNFELLSKHLRISKVYLEVSRDMVIIGKPGYLKIKRFFEDRGVKVSSGITTTVSERNGFQTYCYTNPEHRAKLKEIVKLAAGMTDELILDDFFFTNCKCANCIQAKGKRSWAEFRLALMKEAAESLVLKPAKETNPKIHAVIKYPNWYEHFQFLGFNLEAQPRIFDGIYTGTETRDPFTTNQHLQEYHGYQIMRFFENVKPGGNGGGWVDPFARGTLDHYNQQLEMTLLAKAKELTLFCFDALIQPIRQPDGTLVAASEVVPAAGEVLERLDAILGRLGQPQGIACYKPYHSSGEDFLHSYLGMIGLPIEMSPTFPENAELVLLSETAKFDPDIVAKIKRQLENGKEVAITSGLLRVLQDKGIKDIADLQVTSRKVLTNQFSGLWDRYESAEPIQFDQIDYATNDSWEDISALSGSNGYPILHRADYGKGRLFVLNIPDVFSDLTKLPEKALDQIRRRLGKGLPVMLQGPSKVSLFTYDNRTFVVHNFQSMPVMAGVTVKTGSARITNLATGQTMDGIRNGEWSTFRVRLEPRRYLAFQWEP